MATQKQFRLIQQLGSNAGGVSFISSKMVVPTVIILMMSFVLKLVVQQLSWLLICLIACGAIVFWNLVAWQGNYYYLSKLLRHLHPRWRKQAWKQGVDHAEDLLCEPPPVKPTGQSFHLSLQFVSVLLFGYEGQDVGAYLLRRESFLSRLLGNQGTDWQVVFVFRTQGFHTHLSEEQAELQLTRIDQGMRELPLQETLSIVQRLSRADVSANERCSFENTALDVIDAYEIARQSELAAAGHRKDIEILLYATYTCEQSLLQGDDWIAMLINSMQLGVRSLWVPIKLGIERLMQSVNGETQAHDIDYLTQFLQRAYTQGFFQWQAHLSQKLGLHDIQPLTPAECWQEGSRRINGEHEPLIARPLSHLIAIRSNDITQEGISNIAPRRVLVRQVPQDSPSSVKTAGNVQMIARLIAKPAGANSPEMALRFLWQFIHDYPDIEVITQVSRADSQTQRAILSWQSRRAAHAAERAAQSLTPDVGAEHNRDGSLQAESKLIAGEAVINVALIIKAIAPTKREAEARLRSLCQTFPAPMLVEIDYDGAWRSWQQQLFGLTWSKLLLYSGSFDQRQKLFSSETALLLPLSMPRV